MFVSFTFVHGLFLLFTVFYLKGMLNMIWYDVYLLQLGFHLWQWKETVIYKRINNIQNDKKNTEYTQQKTKMQNKKTNIKIILKKHK